TVEEVGAGKEETLVIREESAWMRFTLWEGKRFVFYCSVPGHREAGMEGTIKVSPGLEAKDLKPF
ncbi:MAG TPA: plastocyanin/azurin family copper-binding protein, partial [Solirubrobacterales bacterium]